MQLITRGGGFLVRERTKDPEYLCTSNARTGMDGEVLTVRLFGW